MKFSDSLKHFRERPAAIRAQAQQAQACLDAIDSLQQFDELADLDGEISYWSNYVQFNVTPGEQAARVIKAFGGKFTKEFNTVNGTFNFTRNERLPGDLGLYVVVSPTSTCEIRKVSKTTPYTTEHYEVVPGTCGPLLGTAEEDVA